MERPFARLLLCHHQRAPWRFHYIPRAVKGYSGPKVFAEGCLPGAFIESICVGGWLQATISSNKKRILSRAKLSPASA